MPPGKQEASPSRAGSYQWLCPCLFCVLLIWHSAFLQTKDSICIVECSIWYCSSRKYWIRPSSISWSYGESICICSVNTGFSPICYRCAWCMWNISGNIHLSLCLSSFTSIECGALSSSSPVLSFSDLTQQ